MKIMRILESMWESQNHENHTIPYKNYENHIPCDNHENIGIPYENCENHDNFIIQKKKKKTITKIIEFHKRESRKSWKY